MGLWSVVCAWFGKFYSGVEVFEVTPTYYAGGIREKNFTLQGVNFSSLPSGAVGIIATYNDDPLHYVNGGANFEISLSIVSDTEISALHNTTMNNPSYFGAIVSNDRQTIFWVNTSRPLP